MQKNVSAGGKMVTGPEKIGEKGCKKITRPGRDFVNSTLGGGEGDHERSVGKSNQPT